MAEKIICVVGPTACGKTKLGVLLAKRYDGEVVSADSMQIYKGMTIGTAAPTAEEMEGVPHHMIAVADPAEQWSAAPVRRAAVPIVDDILRRGKRPILVGGTGCGWMRWCRAGPSPAATPAALSAGSSRPAGREGIGRFWRSCGRWTRRRRNASIRRMRSASSGRWRSTGRRERPSPPTTRRQGTCRPGTTPCGSASSSGTGRT